MNLKIRKKRTSNIREKILHTVVKIIYLILSGTVNNVRLSTSIILKKIKSFYIVLNSLHFIERKAFGLFESFHVRNKMYLCEYLDLHTCK